MQLRRSLLAAACVVASAAPAESQPPAAARDGAFQALTIPYANGPISARHAPQIRLRLSGDGPRRFGMDTGSTGIVVSAEHYIPAPDDTDDGPGRLVYNSSGRILHGRLHTTTVAILGPNREPAATARVQVLRVTHISCLARARACRSESAPRGVASMGIGFARDAAQGTEPGAPRNPFVHLAALASGAPATSVRPGYVVTRTAVHLGITAELARGFALVKLRPAQPAGGRRPRWHAAPMTLSVNGVAGDGTILIDTGIDYMFLSPPPGSGLVPGERAPRGTDIRIALANGGAVRASYRLTVGDQGNPLHPEKVEVVHDAGVFVNTGRMFLQGFDYLYDAAAGLVGYRWTGRASSAFGGVTPQPAAR